MIIETISKEEFINGDGKKVLKKSGPRLEHTRKAQEAVDEFVASDADVCTVDWREISDDFGKAKKIISSRLPYTKWSNPDACDVAMRSNRDEQEIYLIREKRMGGGAIAAREKNRVR